MWTKIRSLVRTRPKGVDLCRDKESGLCVEEYFHTMVHLAEKRSEESGRPFLLMRLSIDGLEGPILRQAAEVVLTHTREVDLKGWWHTGREIGILFTEINGEGRGDFIVAEKIITDKLKKGLLRKLGITIVARLRLSCTPLPEREDGRQKDVKTRPELPV